MSQINYDNNIQCPFYQGDPPPYHGTYSIYCEGASEYSRISHTFTDKHDRGSYKDKYCRHGKRWKYCPIAAGLNTKYE